MEAESALATARAQWRREPRRAPQPPTRVYLCPRCDAWHMAHVDAKRY